MTQGLDPFRHHPDLRPLIAAAKTSYFRGFTPQRLRTRLADAGLDTGWIADLSVIDACHRAALAPRRGQPFWIFGYGSLMWDPAIEFDEVRRAHLSGFTRRMCLVDARGARGSPERPGLMAGLAAGGGCDGLAFRLPGETAATESAHVFRRELVGQAYRPHFAWIDTALGPELALTFVVDPSSENIRLDLDPAAQAQMIATGEGFLGSSLCYLRNTLDRLAALGVAAHDLSKLYATAQELRDRASAAQEELGAAP